jgi:hypothetical protein
MVFVAVAPASKKVARLSPALVVIAADANAPTVTGVDVLIVIVGAVVISFTSAVAEALPAYKNDSKLYPDIVENVAFANRTIFTPI